MAKITKPEPTNVVEQVSRTEEFFKKYSKLIYCCTAAVLAVALCILLYNRFVLQPKKAEAVDQLAQAERWFEAGEYELALSGDENALGLDDIISTYGSKAGCAVYLYAGIAKYNTSDFEGALAALKKYNGKDEILSARAQACIGDCYVELEDLPAALSAFKKAASIADNIYAADYLIKAGIVAEELGNTQEALSLYKQVKEKYENAPVAQEIDKYISRIEK